MPIYEYECEECRHRLEAIQTIDQGKNEPLKTCPACTKPALRRVFGNFYVHYKGPGFATTEARGITGRKRKPKIKVGYVRDLPPEEREKHLG